MIVLSMMVRVKCALVLMVFMLLPIFPITSTICLFAVIFRPRWFKQLVDKVYEGKSN